ncbi:MAG TPA: c-type cytochrome biogenesis protein CcmI [Lautropia sp.]|nr:c-type cytochrome biogenesis protein CcmI [Lautropia sp.]
MSPELFLLLVLAPLGLLTTAYVVWPLLRRDSRRAAGGDASAKLNREIVLERRAQLERELAQLPSDSPDRDRLILEFSSAALTDLEPQGKKERRSEPKRWVMAAALASMLAAGPLVFYRLAGLPDAASPDFAARSQPQDLPTLVAELERRLQAEPQSPDGWLLLGRSKMSLGDLPGATAAMERALSLDSPVPELASQIRVDLADALAQGASSRLAGRPWVLVQEALKRDGNNQKALALAGAYQVTQGNRAGALTYWEPLLAQLAPGSEQHAQIAAFVNDLRAGRDPGSAPDMAAGPDGSAATGAAGAGASEGGAAGTPGSAQVAGPVLRGRIEIDPKLAARAGADDTVFIAARGVDQEGRPSGPPAAVLRARAADLPLDFEMTDRDAMSPASKLSGQSRVVVVARVSRAGTAAGSAGDLEGRSQPVAPDAQAVQVRIDRLLE